MLIPLTEREYDFMDAHGAALTEADPASPSLRVLGGNAVTSYIEAVQADGDRQVYMFMQDCPFLAPAVDGWRACTIYKNPSRPAACTNLIMKSQPCKDAISMHDALEEMRQSGKQNGEASSS